MKAKLKDIIDHMDMRSETRGSYVNLKTGEIISLSDEDLAIRRYG
ncbi:hypothetical protein HNR77_005836 [Paenibacillus sp. JGP012]|nr:hypothetical protein [Paenibacillus sp. JGP012]MBB6024701.1 hypothetical protein [Paenibacillus sp. JGP012]